MLQAIPNPPENKCAPPMRVSSRINKGKPYIHAYISVGQTYPKEKILYQTRYTSPVDTLHENFILPQLHGGTPINKSNTSTPFHPRSRSFIPCRNFKAKLVVPATQCDESWYSPTQPTDLGIVASAFISAANYTPDYPLPSIVDERYGNMYQLPTDILNSVAFLSEITNPLDIPIGLRLPKYDMHEVPYNKAFKDPIKYPRPALTASVEKEIAKLTDKYQALQIVTNPSQIEPGALFINGILLSKVKYLADGQIDRISTRFALNGTL